MNKYDISIVIPTANGNDKLTECIESLSNQKQPRFEVICVCTEQTEFDRGIIEKYKASGLEISCVTLDDHVQSGSWDMVMNSVSGEYVIFMSPDCILGTDALKIAYDKAVDNSADIVLIGTNSQNSTTGELKNSGKHLDKKRLPDTEPFSRKDYADGGLWSVTCPECSNKLYRKAFLYDNRIKMKNVMELDDAFMIYTSLSVAERICAVRDNIINIRQALVKGGISADTGDITAFIKSEDGFLHDLMERNVYSDIERDYVNRVLSVCCSNLKAYRNNMIVQQIMEAIIQSDFYNCGLMEHPEEYYTNIDNYFYVRSFVDGKKWCLDREHKLNDTANYSIVVNRSSEIVPKVSVVIPVYNCAEYIGECVESIMHQTLEEIEIICVNDGSTDDTMEILEELAEKDNRITVVTQGNRGASVARNHGIDIATGEYICYVDSDDLLENGTLECLYTKLKRDALDVLFYDGKIRYEEDKFDNSIRDGYYIRKNSYPEVYSGLDMLCRMQLNGDYRVTPCMQIASRKFIRESGIRFEECIYHEDNIYTFQVILNAKRASHVSEAFYVRRVRRNSIMTVKHNWNHCYGYFVSFMALQNILAKHDIEKEQLPAIYEIIYGICSSTQRIYDELPAAEKNYYYYLNTAEYYLFKMQFVSVSDIKKQKNDMAKKLGQTYEEKYTINEKLKAAYEEKTDMYMKLQHMRDDNARIKESREREYERNEELKEKLQQTYAEKSEINAKLRQTYAEKSEINAKLKQTYAEKSEINAKLKQAYAEKSEINAKLQQTYAEKTERGVQIKELTKENTKLKSEIEQLRSEVDQLLAKRGILHKLKDRMEEKN